jgi:hypothetical protein
MSYGAALLFINQIMIVLWPEPELKIGSRRAERWPKQYQAFGVPSGYEE